MLYGNMTIDIIDNPQWFGYRMHILYLTLWIIRKKLEVSGACASFASILSVEVSSLPTYEGMLINHIFIDRN